MINKNKANNAVFLIRRLLFTPYKCSQILYKAKACLYLYGHMRSNFVIHHWKIRAWALLIALLSLMPGSDMPKASWLNIPYADKIAHAAFYFILSLLLLANLNNHVKTYRHLWLWPLLATLAYGGLMEWLQYLLQTGRQAEWADMAANISGALMGIVLYPFIANNKLLNKVIN